MLRSYTSAAKDKLPPFIFYLQTEPNVTIIYFCRERQTPDIYFYRQTEPNVTIIYFCRERQTPDIYFYRQTWPNFIGMSPSNSRPHYIFAVSMNVIKTFYLTKIKIK